MNSTEKGIVNLTKGIPQNGDTFVRLSYQDETLMAVDIGGQPWLPMSQLVGPLGYFEVKALWKVYERNADEFGLDETKLMALPTAGGKQEQRIFSLRGARLLALLAKTPQSVQFRKWVLDLIDGKVRPRALPRAEVSPLTLECKTLIESTMARLEPDHPAQAWLRGVYSGVEPLPTDQESSVFVDAWIENIDRQTDVRAEFARIKALAARSGISEEHLKSAIRRRKRALEHSGQGDLLEASDA